MRISDWSSDVCSSDLAPVRGTGPLGLGARDPAPGLLRSVRPAELSPLGQPAWPLAAGRADGGPASERRAGIAVRQLRCRSQPHAARHPPVARRAKRARPAATGAEHHCRTASLPAAAIAPPFPLVSVTLRHFFPFLS